MRAAQLALCDRKANVARSPQLDNNMPTIERIDDYAEELTAIRRDLHAHPEIGFEEVRTSGIVADKLTQWASRCIAGLAAPAWSACSRAKALAASASACAPTWT